MWFIHLQQELNILITWILRNLTHHITSSLSKVELHISKDDRAIPWDYEVDWWSCGMEENIIKWNIYATNSALQMSSKSIFNSFSVIKENSF